LADRVHGGEIVELILLRGYRMHEPVAWSFIPLPSAVRRIIAADSPILG